MGVGYWIYGKRQQELMPMIGGIAIIGASFLVPGWFLMSLLCLALMVGVHLLKRRGW